jgi:hypothetical protein
VVDREKIGLSARPGDIIIVTRKKDGLQEVTARRFQKGDTDCVLTFDSTNGRYNGAVLQLRSLQLHSDQQEAAPDVIGGIAIGVYRPLMTS